MKVKVATFNIQHGVDHVKKLAGTDRVVDLDRVADHIAAIGAEICSLNEIYNCEPDGRFPEQPAYIAKKLGGWYSAFSKAIEVGEEHRPYGNGLVSKYPIRSLRSVPIAVPKEERVENGNYEERVLMIAEIDLGESVLTVMNCHFGLTPDAVKLAVDIILEEKAKINMPMILTGDFNIQPDHPECQRLIAAFRDTTDKIEGSIHTFPSHDPRIKIDYIFTNDRCETLSCVIPQDVISDHLPIVAELEIQ